MMKRHVNTTIQFWETHIPSTRLDIRLILTKQVLIAGMENCDIFMLTRNISLRVSLVVLHNVWTAMRLFCFTIIREGGTVFASPIIVILTLMVSKDPEI